MEERVFFIHPTSELEVGASVGKETKIWQYCHIRTNSVIGEQCVLGRCVFVGEGVVIGNRVKVQNDVSIYHGVIIEDGVFVGPHAIFTNDRVPRAINADGTLKAATDWVVSHTKVRTGASIGANATILCGITIGQWALVGCGSVVTKDVPDHAVVIGNPGRIVGWITASGERVLLQEEAIARSRIESGECRAY